MFPRLPSFISFAVLLAGCVAQPPAVEPASAVVDPVPEPMAEPEIIEDPMPTACELLLARLDETQPYLNDLEAALSGHAERIEKAVARLNQPPPKTPIAECPTVAVGVLGKKEIIGSLEWIYMDPPGHHFRARIDSGAETSSLSASNIVEFERDGDDWVRFTYENDGTDDAADFELPIKRMVSIRQASSEELERRVVIELDIRLGKQLQTTEFTLTDRTRMTYPVLLGRAFLMDLYVVDVAKSFTHKKFEAP